MWNIPSKEVLAKIPRLYETEHISIKDKEIHLHFFIGGSDWYVVEYDGEDQFFGFAILNNDHINSEWGHFSFEDLKSFNVKGVLEIDCETSYFLKVRKVSEIKHIKTYE